MMNGRKMIFSALVAATAVLSLSGTLCGPQDALGAIIAEPCPAHTPVAVEVTYRPVGTPTTESTSATAQTPAPPEPPEPPYSDSEIRMLAKTVYGEAGICATDEQRLVIWTILQRVDADGYGDTIAEVIMAPWQFVGYATGNPIDPDIYALCVEELTKWRNGAEPPTHEVYAPTAPYYFFDGDGRHNWYREEWK